MGVSPYEIVPLFCRTRRRGRPNFLLTFIVPIPVRFYRSSLRSPGPGTTLLIYNFFLFFNFEKKNPKSTTAKKLNKKNKKKKKQEKSTHTAPKQEKSTHTLNHIGHKLHHHQQPPPHQHHQPYRQSQPQPLPIPTTLTHSSSVAKNQNFGGQQKNSTTSTNVVNRKIKIVDLTSSPSPTLNRAKPTTKLNKKINNHNTASSSSTTATKTTLKKTPLTSIIGHTNQTSGRRHAFSMNYTTKKNNKIGKSNFWIIRVCIFVGSHQFVFFLGEGSR